MKKKDRPRSATPGYLSSYNASIERIDLARAAEAERLAAEWSQADDDRLPRACPRCGKPVPIKRAAMSRSIATRFGEVRFRRHYYYCGTCGQGFFPRDVELGLSEEDMSDDILARALDFVVNDPFKIAAERMELHHGVVLSPTKYEHLFERAAAPLADAEKPRPAAPLPLTPSNAHKPVLIENDGSMFRRTDAWREAKLMRIGVVGEESAAYLAETQSAERFESWLRESPGFARLRERTVLWIADGAPYNWGLQKRLAPQAHALVDYWHVMEHVHDCARELFGEGDECGALYAYAASRLLLRSKPKQLIKELNQCIGLTPEGKRGESKREALRKLSGYLKKNLSRLNYAFFLRNHWPIGSGAIESAHKWVLQKRMKQAGMKWSPKNGQRMAVIRALYATVGPKKFHETLRAAA